MTKLRAEHDIRPRKEIFLFSKTSILPERPTHPAIQQDLGVHCRGVKQPWSEAGHLVPLMAYVTSEKSMSGLASSSVPWVR